MDLKHALAVATEAARAAGDLLRADFHRPSGPRGAGDKAEADTESELLIRARLLAAFPEWGFLGEETGRAGGSSGPVWLVDPNDGTRDYLVGRRGSAVSIGLVEGGLPRLGVVYAFGYPDDRGALFTWAEGEGPLLRNGVPAGKPPAEHLDASDVVLVSSKGDRDPAGNLRCAEPARYRSLASIAHRLAVVASGEAAATSSLFGPRDWDYGGGHALLRGAGGVLVDQDGREITYGLDGSSTTRNAYAGSRSVAEALSRRDWTTVATGPWNGPRPARLSRGQAIADPILLARAQGCLLGQAAGDSLGGLVEFESADDIARRHPHGVRFLRDGGTFELIAGQPTDDTEMALVLARAIAARGAYDADAVREAYRAWLDSQPFDVGHATRAALEGEPLHQSEANGSLMRASPLGIYAHALPRDAAVTLARLDSHLTHPSRVCGDAVAAFVVAVSEGIRTGSADAAYRACSEWARTSAVPAVAETLARAAHQAPRCDGNSIGWVLIALQNAFFELLHAPSLAEGVVATVHRGGDTDTNAAIAGALLGAVHGRDAIPTQWRSMILSCHPVAPWARRPRPMAYWPVDVFELSELLLLAGQAKGK